MGDPGQTANGQTRAAMRTQLRAIRRTRFAGGTPVIPLHPELASRLLKAKCVGGYCPMRFEADPMPILEWCHAQGLETALPYIAERGARMEFREWSPGDALETTSFSFKQPVPTMDVTVPDLLLMPLVGFDSAGNRLGQGAGHYDRYLEAHPAIKPIGFGFAIQHLDAIPAEPWDVPLESMVTEHGFVNFSDVKV
jgi:5-formyltetrahydrofolate cyclo-ligase